VRPSVRGMPGLAPAGEVLFLCLPKEKYPKEKAAAVRAAARSLALLASVGVGLNSLRSDNARPDPPAAALLSSARTAWETKDQYRIGKPRLLRRYAVKLKPVKNYLAAQTTAIEGYSNDHINRSVYWPQLDNLNRGAVYWSLPRVHVVTTAGWYA